MGPAKRWGAVGKELHTALHVVAWCQIGVILRVELDALFGGACASGLGEYSWAPCVTSSAGALLTDFPPNVLGSFLMGMLASSDVLSKHLGHTLDAPAPLAALPRGSSLQAHTAFQVGMRTGFCGSLTTFSSWMMQVRRRGGPLLGRSLRTVCPHAAGLRFAPAVPRLLLPSAAPPRRGRRGADAEGPAASALPCRSSG